MRKCPLPNATKLFPDQRLCIKKTPSPSSKLLPTNASKGIQLSFEDRTTLLPGGGGGGGGGKNQSAMKFRKNAPQVCNFLNSFVQDCSLLMHAQKNKTSTVGLKQTCDLHHRRPKLSV